MTPSGPANHNTIRFFVLCRARMTRIRRAGSFKFQLQNIGEVKLNATGAFLSVCNSNGPGQPVSCDSFLYVIDLESASSSGVRYFNFNSGRNETDDHAG